HVGAYIDDVLRKLEPEHVAFDEREYQRLDHLPRLQRHGGSERTWERDAGRQLDGVHAAFLASVEFTCRIGSPGEAFVNASETMRASSRKVGTGFRTKTMRRKTTRSARAPSQPPASRRSAPRGAPAPARRGPRNPCSSLHPHARRPRPPPRRAGSRQPPARSAPSR